MIIFCKKCLFPNTKPDLYFDDNGICDACHSAETKWGKGNIVDWDERALEFESILSSLPKDRLYDCVVPVSGGKDSTYQTYRMVKEHNLKALAVTFDQFDQTQVGQHNLEVLKEIGVDHVHFTLNPKIVKLLVLRGFEEVGDLYWVNHVGMFSVPTRVATWMKIPLIIYGENPQFEYGGPPEKRKPQPMNKRWRQEFAGLRGLREEDLVDEDISTRDLDILRFPEDNETKDIKGIFYGDYYCWDPVKHTQDIKSFGWKPLISPPMGSSSVDENCDMAFIDIREHIKYLKYGYGRATDQLNIEIRSGNISRDEALIKVREIDGKVSEKNIKKFCEYVGINRNYFDSLVDRFANRKIFDKLNDKWEFKYERN